MNIKKYSEEDLKRLKDQTDYGRLDKMTDEEIEEGATTDPDSLTPDKKDLSKFKKVKKKDEEN